MVTTPTTYVRLLGRPLVEREGVRVESPRGRKTWGLAAYLTLADRPLPRRRIASLLCCDAADPMRSLRWHLTEMRRLFGWGSGELYGDPLVVELPPNFTIDARRLLEGELPTTPTGELLEGLDFPRLPIFDDWLASERRYLSGQEQALLRDRALAELAAGRVEWATAMARRVVDVDPLEARNQEVLVRCLSGAGLAGEARLQAARCSDLFRRELGVDVPTSVLEAASAAAPLRRRVQSVATAAEVRAVIDVGRAAVAAGAVDSGLARLRRALALAAGERTLEAESSVALGQALSHGVGARDSEVATLLHEGLSAAERCGERHIAAQACYELGFIAVQCGESRHAADWLDRAERTADDNDDDLHSAVGGVRGMMLSDVAEYGDALAALEASVERATLAGTRRQAAWSNSLIGRIYLLRGELETAATILDQSIQVVRVERWIAFLPWCEALRAEVLRRRGETEAAQSLAEHALAVATDMGDACWMTTAFRALAFADFDRGRTEAAVEWARRGLERSVPYQWIRASALDAACVILRDVNPDAARKRAEELATLAARGGMRDFAAMAALHKGLLGDYDALESARWLGSEIDNPDLAERVERAVVAGPASA